MARINLLPWRAERRERRKREFFAQLIAAAVAAVVVVLVWGFWLGLRIDNQDGRNTYLTGQIQQLDAKITEIKNLQKVKDHLLARKAIVEKLQASRSQMVHLFDQIVDTIPAGARLTALKQQGDKLTLDGVAQSNATVAEYMRNIEASPWMGTTRLVKTENIHNGSNTPYEFELSVTLGVPKSAVSTVAPAAASSAASATASSAPPASDARARRVGIASSAGARSTAAPAAAGSAQRTPTAAATVAARPIGAVAGGGRTP